MNGNLTETMVCVCVFFLWRLHVGQTKVSGGGGGGLLNRPKCSRKNRM